MSTVEVEGAVLVEFTNIDASACTLVRSLMFMHEQPASVLVSGKATELFPHTLLRLPVARVPCLPGSAHDGRGPLLFSPRQSGDGCRRLLRADRPLRWTLPGALVLHCGSDHHIHQRPLSINVALHALARQLSQRQEREWFQ